MAKSIVDQRRDHAHKSSAAVPGTHPEGLFILFVPTTDNHHEHGTDACFCDAQEESYSVESSVIGACWSDDDSGTPENNNTRSNTFDREALSEDDSRIGSHNVTEIEDCTCEGISIANLKFKIFSKSENGLSGVSQCC